MDLRDRHRDSVALPCFPKTRAEAGLQVQALHPHGLSVDVAVAPVPARLMIGVQPAAMVEEPFAGEIMVDSDYIGFRRARRQQVQLLPAHAGLVQ